MSLNYCIFVYLYLFDFCGIGDYQVLFHIWMYDQFMWRLKIFSEDRLFPFVNAACGFVFTMITLRLLSDGSIAIHINYLSLQNKCDISLFRLSSFVLLSFGFWHVFGAEIRSNQMISWDSISAALFLKLCLHPLLVSSNNHRIDFCKIILLLALKITVKKHTIFIIIQLHLFFQELRSNSDTE